MASELPTNRQLMDYSFDCCAFTGKSPLIVFENAMHCCTPWAEISIVDVENLSDDVLSV